MQTKFLGSLAHVASDATYGLLNVLALKSVGGLGERLAGKPLGIVRLGRSQDKRQVGGIDLVVRAKVSDTLQQIAKLADIARPAVLLEPLLRLGAQLERLAAVLTAELRQEMFG